MGRDDRVALWFLLMSVLLHLGLLLPTSFLQPRETRPAEEVAPARYVVRIPQPAPQRTPPPPLPTPSQPPEPPAMAAAIPPRQPQAVDHSQPRQEPTPVPAITPPQPRPVEPDTPDPLKPRPPTPPKSHANAIRRQRVPALPPVAQLPPPPAEASVRQGAVPRRPSTQGQQAVVPPTPSAPASEQDPLATYLAAVRAAIDRHKRYPAAARRAGITGSVVLQFVILSDGRVIEPSIAESNGYRAFGTAALESLRRASPMPPFPPEIDRDRLVVRVPMTYTLNE